MNGLLKTSRGIHSTPFTLRCTINPINLKKILPWCIAFIFKFTELTKPHGKSLMYPETHRKPPHYGLYGREQSGSESYKGGPMGCRHSSELRGWLRGNLLRRAVADVWLKRKEGKGTIEGTREGRGRVMEGMGR